MGRRSFGGIERYVWAPGSEREPKRHNKRDNGWKRLHGSDSNRRRQVADILDPSCVEQRCHHRCHASSRAH